MNLASDTVAAFQAQGWEVLSWAGDTVTLASHQGKIILTQSVDENGFAIIKIVELQRNN